jgi:hypothetical protein
MERTVLVGTWKVGTRFTFSFSLADNKNPIVFSLEVSFNRDRES